MDKQLRLSLIFRAAGNTPAFLGGMSRDSRTAAEAMNGARTQLNALQRTARDVSSFRAAETRLGQLRNELEEARQEARRLAAAHDATTTPTRAMTRAFEVAKTRLSELSDKEQTQIRTLAQLEDRLRAAGAPMQALGAWERRLAQDIEGANRELSEQSRRLEAVQARQRQLADARTRYDRTQALAGSMQGAGMSSIGAGVAVAAPLAAGVTAATDLEARMTTIAQRSNMSAEATRAFEASLLATGAAANRTRDETLSLFDQLTAQGFEQADALAMGRDVARAATAYQVGDEDLAATAGSLRNLEIAAGQTGRAFDIMAVAGKKGNFEFDAMARSFPALTAGAAAYGMTGMNAVAEIAAAAQIARRGAGSDEAAATNLQNLLQKIGSPETERKFARLGINLRDGLAAGAAAGKSALETIIELTNQATGGDASRLGMIFEDAQVQSALRPLMANLDEFRSMRDEALGAGGEVDRDFQRRMLDNGQAMKAVQREAATSALTLGRNLLPAIGQVSRAVSGALAGFNRWAGENPGLARALAFTAAGIAAVAIAGGAIAVAIAAVLGPWALMRYAFVGAAPIFTAMAGGFIKAAGAAWTFTASLLANPITWIVLGVVALAASVFLIYRNWGRIGPWLGRLWSGIRSAVGSALSWIGSALMRFTPLGFMVRSWGPLTDFLGAVMGAARAVVGLALDGLLYLLVRFTPLGAIMRNWGGIVSWLSGVWAAVSGGVAAGLAAAGSAILNFTPLGLIVRNWGVITGFLSGLWDRARGIVSAGLDVMRGILAAFNPLGAFQSAFASTWTWLSGLPARFLSAGADAIRGFTQGITGQRAALQAATARVAAVPEATTRRVTRTQSPSRAMMAVGSDVMAGFTLGLGRNADAAIGSMRRAALGVVAAAGVSVPAIAAPGVEPVDVLAPRPVPVALQPSLAGRAADVAPPEALTRPELARRPAAVPPPTPTALRPEPEALQARPDRRLIGTVAEPRERPAQASAFTSLARALTTGVSRFTPPQAGGLQGDERAVRPATVWERRERPAQASAFTSLARALTTGMDRFRRPPAGDRQGDDRTVRPASALPGLSPMLDGLGRLAAMMASARTSVSEGPAPLRPDFVLPSFETGPRLSPRPEAAGVGAGGAGLAGAVQPPSIGSVTIQIIQRHGEDEQALARRLMRMLQSPNLAELGDQGADSWGETH